MTGVMVIAMTPMRRVEILIFESVESAAAVNVELVGDCLVSYLFSSGEPIQKRKYYWRIFQDPVAQEGNSSVS